MAGDKPLFYVDNHQEARAKMKELAERTIVGYMDYNAFIEVHSPDKLSIVGYYRNYVISHCRTLDTFSVRRIPRFEDYHYATNFARTLLRSVYETPLI